LQSGVTAFLSFQLESDAKFFFASKNDAQAGKDAWASGKQIFINFESGRQFYPKDEQ